MIRNIHSKQGYDCFEQNFKNRQDFISYLKTAKTSSTFIAKNLASYEISRSNTEWTGTKSFDEALNLFENGWYENFDQFLAQKQQIDKFFPYVSKKKIYHNDICGSVPNVVNAINNLPLSMRRLYEDYNAQKKITIHYNCDIPWYIKQRQVFINGLLTLSLVDFLDSLGYRVELKTYGISTSGNQIALIDLILKSSGEKINLQKFYFAFCHPSFMRRLLFRVMETIQGLDQSWTWHYGRCMLTNEIKSFLEIDKNTIYINEPSQMGIRGHNIEEDIQAFLNAVMLGEHIEIDLDRFNLYDNKHVLRKKKSL